MGNHTQRWPYAGFFLVNFVLFMLPLLAVLACAVIDPLTWGTPSPPQQTAAALNETYVARASETAQASQTSTSGPTSTPTVTFTSSIIESTATRTIIEVTP